MKMFFVKTPADLIETGDLFQDPSAERKAYHELEFGL